MAKKFNQGKFKDGPRLEESPVPAWAENDPAPDYVRAAHRRRRECLTCDHPLGGVGLCLSCFFRFWAKRLQAQGGKWPTRDVPYVPLLPMDNMKNETAALGEIDL